MIRSLILAITTFLLFASTTHAQATPWWDDRWAARFPISINPNNQIFTNKPVNITINFMQKLQEAQFSTNDTLSVSSIRVVDQQNGNVVLPSQLELINNNQYTLTFVIPGVLSVNRTVYVYFDSVTNNTNKPAPPPQTLTVSATDNIQYAGQSSIKIETPNGIYYYHKDGGGFASYIDPQGQDWISFKPTGGSAGNFRGIPNLVHPDSLFHPGDTNVTTTLKHIGTVKTTIESISKTNAWKTRWEIYPTFAYLTVLEKPTSQPYWFLYEGTPGGSIDLLNDFYYLPDGQRRAINQPFTQDINGSEWAYFGDDNKNIVLYAASNQDDTHIDSYWLMDNNMTVFGFGRDNTNKFLQQVPATFSFGFTPKSDHNTIKNQIQSNNSTLVATSNTAEKKTTTTTPTGTPSCTAKFKGDADCSSKVDILDYAIWYGEFVGQCADTLISGCGVDSDKNGNTMDANFNFPGTDYISTDMKVDVFDYAVWIQGYLAQNQSTIPTPTSPQPTQPPPTNPPPTGIGSSAKVLFDGPLQFTESHNGFLPFKNDGSLPPGMPQNWLSPDNFYNGVWHWRYKILENPGSEKGALQICVWTMPGYKPESCQTPFTIHQGTGDYITSQSPSEWWNLEDIRLDYSNPTNLLARIVLRGENGCNITTFNVPGSCPGEFSKFADMKFRLTVVMVPQGQTFPGWQQYP